MMLQDITKLVALAGRYIGLFLAILFIHLHMMIKPCNANPNGLVLIKVTLLNTDLHPINGAKFMVFDSARRLLEDPGELGSSSDDAGHDSRRVPATSTYYIRGYGDGYLPTEKKVISTANVIAVILVLKRAPLPPYPTTTVQAKIVDTKHHPVEGAFLAILDEAGQDLGSLMSSPDLDADKHGRIEKVVRTGGVYRLRVDARGYQTVTEKVTSKPGIIPITIVLKRLIEQKQ